MISNAGTIDPGPLRRDIRGTVTAPSDAGWEQARQAWNLAAEQRPALVVDAAADGDVRATLRFARERGLRVTVQSTGHQATALRPLDGVVLLRTRRLAGVRVDPERRTARVAAGASAIELVTPASAAGLAALAGSSPGIGFVGYALGGGLGWLARRHGLAAWSVTALEAVTGDGRAVRADAGSEPDLFWALRGAGDGGFAVVTALETKLHPVPSLQAGVLMWPWEQAARVLRRWRDWTRELPEEVTSLGRVLRLPPVPAVPEPLRGRSFVAVEAAMLMDAPEADRLLAPLRELRPEVDTFDAVAPRALSYLHNDPEDPTPAASGHAMLRDLDDATLDALVETCGPGSDSPLVSVEVRHCGGALARPARGAALDRVDDPFMLFGVGATPDADAAAAVEAHLARLERAVAAATSDRVLLNFVERPGEAASAAFPSDVHARLRAVKAAYDPQDVLLGAHPIAPAR